MLDKRCNRFAIGRNWRLLVRMQDPRSCRITRPLPLCSCYECEADEVYSTIQGEALSLYT